MKEWFKNNLFGIIYGLLLVGFTTYALLDVFVIPHRMGIMDDSVSASTLELADNLVNVSDNFIQNADNNYDENAVTTLDDVSDIDSDLLSTDKTISENETVSENESASENVVFTVPEMSDQSLDATDGSEFLEVGRYLDKNISIVLNRYYYCSTYVYVADIFVSTPAYLKTAFANDTYGRNINKKTTMIAADHGAILAINGDFYGARQSGYVIRNGVLFGDVKCDGNQDLAIKNDGSFMIFNESDIAAADIYNQGVWQSWSFGPALVMGNEISVGEKQEVAHAMYSNPRTAIGEVKPGHYYFLVSDGRTEESKGLSLYQLAEFMKNLGCVTAYNLDGGGSSALYFDGQLINKPSPGNGIIAERSVSDIVYIGY